MQPPPPQPFRLPGRHAGLRLLVAVATAVVIGGGHLLPVATARQSIYNGPGLPMPQRRGLEEEAIDYRVHHGIALSDTKELPYQLGIIHTYTELLLCGGIIITPRRCVTVAHCVAHNHQPLRPSDVKLLAGTAERAAVKLGVYTAVVRIRLHPLWARQNVRHDLAVLIPEKDLVATDGTIGPVPMPLRAFQQNKEVQCTASGWGRTEYDPEPSNLKRTWVTTMERQKCDSEWAKNLTVNVATEYLCGWGLLDVGDSGGPLMCGGRLVGIASFASKTKQKRGFMLVFMDAWKEREFLLNGARGRRLGPGLAVALVALVVALVAAAAGAVI